MTLNLGKLPWNWMQLFWIAHIIMSHSSIEKWCFASVNSVYALHISIMYLATTFRPKTPANKAAMIKTPTRDHSKDSFENTCCRVFRNFHPFILYHLTYVGSRVVLKVAFQSKSNLKPKCGRYSRSLYVAALTCLKQFCAKVLKASVRCIRETRKKAFLKISLLAPRLVELHAVEFVGSCITYENPALRVRCPRSLGEMRGKRYSWAKCNEQAKLVS